MCGAKTCKVLARLKKFLAVNKQISSAVSNERSNHIQAEGEEREVKDAKGGTALASSKVTQRMFDSYLKLCPLPKWPNKDLSDEGSQGDEESRIRIGGSLSPAQHSRGLTRRQVQVQWAKDKPLRRLRNVR